MSSSVVRLWLRFWGRPVFALNGAPAVIARGLAIAGTLLLSSLWFGWSVFADTKVLRSDNLSAVWLHDYQLDTPPLELSMITHNGSGLSYNFDTDTLFAVVNNPTFIVEMDKSGQELRKIDLKGFDDTEGLVYLGGGRFAIVEEEHRGVVIVDIDESTEYLLRHHGQGLSFVFSHKKNKGFEGVAYNPFDGSLFVVNEKQPRALYRIDGAVAQSSNAVSISSPWSMEENSLDNKDLSGLHFHAHSGNLLLLSDDSKSITETSLSGNVISRLSLKSGRSGLDDAIPQAEGITMDAEGNLYVLSEPNLFYRFAPKLALAVTR